MLGVVLLPSATFLSKKVELGSSISMLIKYQDRSLGVKFTIVNSSYIIGTFRIPGKIKIGHYIIPKPINKKVSFKDTVVTFKMKAGNKGRVTASAEKPVFSTSIKGIQFGKVKFHNSNNDDIPSAEGFWQDVGDAISDIASGISAGITWLVGGEVVLETSGGGYIKTGTTSSDGQRTIESGFKSEEGLEEENGVWY